MRRTLFTIALVAALSISPALLHAQVYSTVEATANTGGNTAESGTVRTGNASASAVVQTTSTNGSSTVQVKTEANGQVYEETFTAPQGKVEVQVKATPATTQVTVQKGDEPPVTYTATTSTSTEAPARTSALLRVPQQIVESIFGWVGILLSLFF